MKKQFDFDNIKLLDYEYIEDIYLDEDICVKLNELVDELGLSHKLKFHKTEFEEEIPAINTWDDSDDKKKPMRNLKQNYNKINEDFILNSVKYSNTIEYIDLSQLYEIDDSINFFDDPSDEEFLNLIKSIEIFGVIQPILTKKDENGNYMVICGRSRLYASKKLYQKTKDERFFKLPCIVLDESCSYSLIQGITIATNTNYRTLSREAYMKSIFLLDEIYRNCNMYRSGTGATAKIAQSIGVSTTTISNYLELKNLSPLAMDLVVNKYMNLSVARVLSRKDHATQNLIITGLKNNINDIEKVYEMMKGPSESIYDKETQSMIKDTWEMKTARVNKMLPQYTYITLKVAVQDVEEVFTGINDFRREYALKYLPLRNNGLNKYFKVTFNEHHIEQYIKSGHLTQKTYDKLTTGVFNEIIKSA